jgi:hypothetical protein
MTRRAHQAEGTTPLHCLACHVHGGARSSGGMFKDAGISGCVRIEIERRIANPREMLA